MELISVRMNVKTREKNLLRTPGRNIEQAYICIDTEHQEGKEISIDHGIPLTKESGAYILKTLE